MSENESAITIGVYSIDGTFSKTLTYDDTALGDQTVRQIIDDATTKAMVEAKSKFKGAFPSPEGVIGNWFPTGESFVLYTVA